MEKIKVKFKSEDENVNNNTTDFHLQDGTNSSSLDSGENLTDAPPVDETFSTSVTFESPSIHDHHNLSNEDVTGNISHESHETDTESNAENNHHHLRSDDEMKETHLDTDNHHSSEHHEDQHKNHKYKNNKILESSNSIQNIHRRRRGKHYSSNTPKHL
ncbi:hypothetical protein MN116_004315 [Schistosoma mekongi]|uniref:Uncharacterized protein n=1 Tax=Schistosoma mekongi TaxID=38744 RepID=A0AAE1ZFM1_SCHME|nr:hypothetical protein MN116_004315 [Schistosoma mekongi]